MDSYAGYDPSSDAQRAISPEEFSDALASAEWAFWDSVAQSMRDAGVIGGDFAPDASDRFERATGAALWHWLSMAELTPNRRAELCGLPAPATAPDRATVTAFLGSGPGDSDLWAVTYSDGSVTSHSGWAEAYDSLKARGFHGIPGQLDYWGKPSE